MRRARPYALLFLALSVIYHSNLRPIAAGDSLPAALLPFSIILDHSLALDRFGPWLQQQAIYGWRRQPHERWYSGYPIAGPILVSPLYLPAAAIPGLRQWPPESLVVLARIMEKFVAALLAAASAVWMFALLRRMATIGWAWALTCVFALGTAVWSTCSQSLWQHTYGVVAIVGCWYFLSRWEAEAGKARWAWCCGAMAAVALMIRPTNAVFFLALPAALYLRSARPRDYVGMLLPPIVAAVLVAAFNEAVFGRLSGGYPAMPLSSGFARGAAGLLFSPARGLLIYTPIALFGLAPFLPAAREYRRKHLALVTACAVFCVAHVAVVANWPNWWGGYCWGPRLLTEVIPSLIILIAVGAPAIRGAGRVAFAAIALYCFLVQGLGVYSYPKGHWDSQPVSVDQAPQRLWDWSDNPIARAWHAGPAWEPYAIVKTAWKEGLPAAREKLRAIGIAVY